MKTDVSVVKLIKSLLFIGSLLVLLQVSLAYMEISFTSDKARTVLLQQIKSFTQRDVRIDGEVRITVSLMPQLLVERIHIKNTRGFSDEYFITVSEVRVDVSLLALLDGNIHLDELSADHASIGLIKKKDESNNWSFDHLLQMPELIGKGVDEPAKKKINTGQVSLGVFRLTDITVEYKDESYNQAIEKHVEVLIVDLKNKSKPQAEIAGSLQGYPYEITLNSDPIKKLASGQPWKLNGSGLIADRNTRIKSVIYIDKQTVEGNINLNIQDIDFGLMLEHLGIINGEDAACRELNVKAVFKGEVLTEIIEHAELEFQLQSGYLKWPAFLKQEIRELTFDKASLRTSWNEAVKLHLDGKLFNEVIKIDFNTAKLSEFFDDMDKLDVDLQAHIEGSDISLTGTVDLPIETRQIQLDISIKGKDLENLNRILNSELPPFNNYKLNGRISANAKGFIVKADDASIGDTNFNTVIVIDTSSFKPFWTVNLNSSQLQIKDFEFAESIMEVQDAATITASLKQAGSESKEAQGRRLKQIVDNPKIHFDLNLKVGKLLVGESVLGASSLRLKLRDDTLILDDLELDIPGGKIKSAASFKVENKQVKGAIKLDIHKFEYGAVARYFTQDSRQGGIISARIDLKLGGRDFSRLFDHATGKLDVALWPGNTNTKIFDIWATNLILLILPEIRKKESRLNCLVALMDLNDGIMKEDLFLMDTTKVWMHGNINVNFIEENLRLSLYPRSKTARMFAVQAPIRAEGSFSDIKLNTNPVDITVAYLSFITSPLHVPARRVFGDKIPEDASELCDQLFDREYAMKLKEKHEAEEQKEIDELLDLD